MPKDHKLLVVPVKPKIARRPPRHMRARNFLIELPDPLTEIGLEECTITIVKGKQTLKGVTKDKKAVHIVLRDGGNGFQEQIVSLCAALSPRERRIEAKKLRKEGLSQTAIAARLGVSQKTISNDLEGR
ncbi:helix-turn-helix domain-containing protein [Agrobacterium sp. P15N1-A]|uniref:helix-turn-helix domain-containing protein n=1 Tax=Agrobacterium sp. P15N1-A TaxID=3342820 RepID=UPI0037D249C0